MNEKKKVRIIGYDYVDISKYEIEIEVESNGRKLYENIKNINNNGNKLPDTFSEGFLRFMNSKVNELTIFSNNDKQKDFQFYQEGPGIIGSNIVGVYREKEYTRKLGGNIVGVYREKEYTRKQGEQGDDAQKDTTTYDVTLEIHSRFDKNIKKPYFLAKMLLEAELENGNLDDFVNLSMDDIFDYLLVYQFKKNLRSAYVQGFYRTYQRFEKNDSRVRGSIDVARHIRLNMGQNNGKVAYSYRENTVDNSLNHLFLHTYQFIKKEYPQVVQKAIDSDREMKDILTKLQQACPGFAATNIRRVMSDHMKRIAHPYYQGYEKLRRTSIDILRRKGLSPFSGDDAAVEGTYMLFYIPDLWEKYVLSLLGRLEDRDISFQEEVEVLKIGDKYRLNTRPDYIIKDKKGKPVSILDAKFRPVWDDVVYENDCHWVESDYTKCLRDMVDVGVHKTGVIFPSEHKTEVTECEISKYQAERDQESDKFYAVSLKVIRPEDHYDFKSWSKEQEKEETQFIKNMKDSSL